MATSSDFAVRLEPGDQLSRQEFERRYEPMPYLRKGELKEGMVDLHSPICAKKRADTYFLKRY